MSIAIPKEDFFPIEDKNKRNKDDLFRHMNWLHEYRIYAINGSLKHMVWYAQELMTDGQVEESLKWFMTALHYGSDIAANILDGELASLGIRRGRIVWEYDEKIAFSLLERARLGNVEARFYVWESISRLHNKNTCIRVRENLISIYSDYLEYSTLYSIEDNCFVFTSFKLINSERYYNFIKDISSDRAEKFPVTLSAKKELHEFEKERDLKEMRERNKFEQLIISYKAMTDELSNQNTICWICKKKLGG